MNRTFLKGAALVLVAALVLAACNKGGSGGTANAQSGGRGSVTLTEADFKYTMTKDGSGVKLLEYLGDKGGNLIIPATFEGFPVVAIGDIDSIPTNETLPNGEFKGFANERTEANKDGFVHPDTKRKNHITSVTIPDTVTFIGRNAFQKLPNLTSITFPKSLKFIGSGAFDRSGLTSVTIPDGVIIGNAAFMGCRLTTITIEENVEIQSNAFISNSELTTVNIAPSVKFCGNGGYDRPDNDAFKSCPKLNIAAQNVIKEAGYTGKF